jgi:23S rRNA pseudouridine1911/1915/1917 synthase
MKDIVVLNEGMLLEYLINNVDSKSKNNIKTMLKNKSILVNNVTITKFDHQLKKGDIISFRKIVKNNNLNQDIDIIYEDNNIIVINKPSSLLSIANEKEKEKTAYILVSDYLKSKNKNAKVFVVHRLDRDTSGVLLFAKDEKTKDIFQEKWNDLVELREYYAVVEGSMPIESKTITSYLVENKNKFVYSTKDKKAGKLAITNYQVIKSNISFSLVKFEIDSGRKNQIRVHMSEMGFPILGDKKYGSKKNPLRRTALHASKLTINNPVTERLITFETEIPKEFRKMFK